MSIFKALGVLLTYPEAPLVEAVPEIEAILDGERGLSATTRRALGALLSELASWDLLDLQERYVGTFDRTRHLSLHLFEHVHGDSRERGQAMVSLSELYRSRGLLGLDRELPDFLPLFCEFLSWIDCAQAREHLADAGPVLAILRARLEERKSSYAGVMAALVELCGASAHDAAVQAALSEDVVSPDDFEALDREWQEQPVTFGLGAAHDSCGTRGGYGSDPLVQLRRK